MNVESSIDRHHQGTNSEKAEWELGSEGVGSWR